MKKAFSIVTFFLKNHPILQGILDFTIIATFCTVFAYNKDIWLLDTPRDPSFSFVFRGTIDSWLREDIPPPEYFSIRDRLYVAIASILAFYPVFLVGFRILKSPQEFFAMSWLSVVWFTFIIIFFGHLFFVNTGYSDTLYDSSTSRAFDVFYVLFSPVIFMALIASGLLYHSHTQSISENKNSATPKAIRNALRRTIRFLIDFVIIIVLCIAFSAIKNLCFHGRLPDNPADWKRFYFVTIIIGIQFSLASYPLFLVAFRVLRSPKIFCIMSWIMVFSLLGISIWWYWNLHYGDFLTGGIPTPLGFFYLLLTPHTLMALWATWLYYKSRTKQTNGEPTT